MNKIRGHKFCYGYSIDKKISYICQNEYKAFLKFPNVVGVAVGYKVINGFYTNEKCITVFVSKKISLNNLNRNDIIPTIYCDIKTDVIESGILKANGLRQKVRPTICGYSIGPKNNRITGSIGCLVKDKNGDVFILSNNHIIAFENRIPIGTEIIQPGRDDKGIPLRDTVAILSKYIPIKFENMLYSPTNYVDCAMAKVLDKSQALPDIAMIGKIKGVDVPKINDHVQKAGRTSALTEGVILNLNATIKVKYIHGYVLLKKQIVTTKMCEYGDSGSVIVNDNKYVVGMVVGSSGNISVHNEISLVLQNLNVDIVTDD